MIGTRSIICIILTLSFLTPTLAGGGGLFSRKVKSDARVKQIAEILRNEADESKRLSAIAELKDADPRGQPEVVPALVAALQRDPSPQVRADAAEILGQFKIVFSVAGAALETASESDPSTIVRGSSRQALWEYHLAGYRAAKPVDRLMGQSTEPPIARPITNRPVIIDSKPILAVSTATAKTFTKPIDKPARPKMETRSSTSLKPPVEVITEPSSSPRLVYTSAPPLHLNLTDEPPIAKPADLQSIVYSNANILPKIARISETVTSDLGTPMITISGSPLSKPR